MSDSPVTAPAVPTTTGCDSRLVLPDGQWADFRNPDELRARDRKVISRLMDSDSTLGEFAVTATDAILGMLVLGWSYPVKAPAEDLTVLDDLTIPVENALQGHPYVLAATRLLLPQPDQSPTNAAAKDEPASPTVPSSV